jgi:hypothetical protein
MRSHSLVLLKKMSNLSKMTEDAKKKPPPPRPLKRSSLSGNQTLKLNSELPLEARETSEPDEARYNTTHSGIAEVSL